MNETHFTYGLRVWNPLSHLWVGSLKPANPLGPLDLPAVAPSLLSASLHCNVTSPVPQDIDFTSLQMNITTMTWNEHSEYIWATVQENQFYQSLHYSHTLKYWWKWQLKTKYTVKTVLSGHPKSTPKLDFNSYYHLMLVKSIAECSKGSILQYFWPSLSYHLSLRSVFCIFLSGRLGQVLL